MVNSRPSSIRVRTEGPTITTFRSGQRLGRTLALAETSASNGTALVIINPLGMERVYLVYIILSRGSTTGVRLNVGGYDLSTSSIIAGSTVTLITPGTRIVTGSGSNSIGYSFQNLASQITFGTTVSHRVIFLIKSTVTFYLRCLTGPTGTTASYINRHVSFNYPIMQPPPLVTSRLARYGICIERLGTIMNGRITSLIVAPSAPFTVPNSNGRTFSVITANPGGADITVQQSNIGLALTANYLTAFTYNGYSVTFPAGVYTLAVIRLDPAGTSSYGRGQTAGSWTYNDTPTVKETFRLGSDMSATQSLYLQSVLINGVRTICRRGIPTFTPP